MIKRAQIAIDLATLEDRPQFYVHRDTIPADHRTLHTREDIARKRVGVRDAPGLKEAVDVGTAGLAEAPAQLWTSAQIAS
jgi:hypothetical protein